MSFSRLSFPWFNVTQVLRNVLLGQKEIKGSHFRLIFLPSICTLICRNVINRFSLKVCNGELKPEWPGKETSTLLEFLFGIISHVSGSMRFDPDSRALRSVHLTQRTLLTIWFIYYQSCLRVMLLRFSVAESGFSDDILTPKSYAFLRKFFLVAEKKGTRPTEDESTQLGWILGIFHGNQCTGEDFN